ncbi:MAG: DUF2490 domain-containing protein [Bacteroidales bacterium]|nr:DUF2490 domain-containing protein [Bacteroidales bacterium]
MKKTLLIILSVLTISTADAQTEKRTSLYLNAGVEKEFLPYLSGGVSVEGRFCDNKTKDLMLKPYVEFSPVKFFSFAAEYRFDFKKEDGEPSETIGRLGLTAKLKYKFNGFRPEVSLKYYNYNEDYIVNSQEETKQYLKPKFQLGYRIKPWKLTPYVSYEWYYNFPRKLVDKDRWIFGAKKKFSNHTFTFEYRLYEKFNRVNNKGTKVKNDITDNIFLFGYKYTFPYKSKKSE